MIVSATGTNVPPITAVTILGGRTQWEGVADSAGTQKRMECHRASTHCRKWSLSSYSLNDAIEFSSSVMVYRDRILAVF